MRYHGMGPFWNRSWVILSSLINKIIYPASLLAVDHNLMLLEVASVLLIDED